MATVLFSIVSALWAALFVMGLNKWASGSTVLARTCLGMIAALAPAVILVVIAVLPSSGVVLLSMSPDEFLVPFIDQNLLTLAMAGPVAWLVARRVVRTSSAEVFD
ncbi:MAG TPA: hypothetical protein VFP14_03725 [Novosphingobium sp.]|nr:hypothetical protein [Novosphingobium sp.]